MLLPLLEPRGSRDTFSFSVCLPTCRSCTGHSPMKADARGLRCPGEWYLPVLSPPLAEQGHVLTGTGIHHCTCAQVERCLAGMAQGVGPGPRGTDCVRPGPPTRRLDGLPLRAEACSAAGDSRQAEPPPPPPPPLPHKPPPPGISTPCSWLAQEKETGNRRHPWEWRGKEGKQLPRLERIRPFFPGLGRCP